MAKRIGKHLAIPLIVAAAFFVVASLPIELIGCRNRGLIAGVLALVAGIPAIILAVKGLIGRMRGDSDSLLWIVAALILAIPIMYIVLMAH